VKSRKSKQPVEDEMRGRLTEKEKESKRNKTKENLEFTVPTERGAAVGIGKPE